MGCDIHTFVERRNPETGLWEHLSGDLFVDWSSADWRTDQPFDRFYGLFAFLADVRQPGDVPCIHPPRGLPNDISQEVKSEFGFIYPEDCPHLMERWCPCQYSASDWHSHSWATGAELLAYDYDVKLPDTGETLREYLGDYIERFQEIAALAPDPADVRVIYAFDS